LKAVEVESEIKGIKKKKMETVVWVRRRTLTVKQCREHVAAT
jgi:hypothetical protein